MDVNWRGRAWEKPAAVSVPATPGPAALLPQPQQPCLGAPPGGSSFLPTPQAPSPSSAARGALLTQPCPSLSRPNRLRDREPAGLALGPLPSGGLLFSQAVPRVGSLSSGLTLARAMPTALGRVCNPAEGLGLARMEPLGHTWEGDGTNSFQSHLSILALPCPAWPHPFLEDKKTQSLCVDTWERRA